MHHRNVNDRKETIKNIKRLIRRKEKDNEQLDADLEELALSVAERRNVNEANGKQSVVFAEQGIVFRVLSLRQGAHVHYLASWSRCLFELEAFKRVWRLTMSDLLSIISVQWNLDITNGQGNGKICSL